MERNAQNGLEEYGPAHNDTLIILDETSLMPTDQKGRPLAFGEALMRLMQGQGKKRNGLAVDRWSTVLISTLNSSVYALLDPKRKEIYEAYTDRLIDIPPPNHSGSFFENLHGTEDDAKFGLYLFNLATQNFGYPGRVFLARLTAELAVNRPRLAALVAGNIAKYEAAASGIKSPRRKELRVRGYFATVYVFGCLAIRFRKSCRSPKPNCSPPCYPAIAITWLSLITKSRAAQSGRLRRRRSDGDCADADRRR